MDAAQAISSAVERIRARGLDYPVTDLTAERFQGGWCVYAPEVLADSDPLEDPVPRAVFLVGVSGRVEEVSSDEPRAGALQRFEEACVWFTAAEPAGNPELDYDLPAHPDLRGSSRPRPAATYDREAIAVLAQALTHEHDFAGWLGDRLRELADVLGGASRLIARSPHVWGAGQVAELAEPLADRDAGVWQTWPAPSPASLPDADTAGWLLLPCVAACDFLEGLESETDAATRLADAVADRAGQAPWWRACGVAELMPQLVALRRTDGIDADLATLRRLLTEHDAGDVVDSLLLAPAPGDADVEALLRLAIDADRRHREVVDLDVAAAAAYRRVLERLDLPFQNYAIEAMFE